MTHIIYIPGLGDKYDFMRKLGLLLWRRKGVKVSHFPIKWEHPDESYEQKHARLEVVIGRYPDAELVLVGESAGGPFALSALRRYGKKVTRVVTVCGMNQGEATVNPALYRKNRAFHDAMFEADRVVASLRDDEKSRLYTIYSSLDFTVRPKSTLLLGVPASDLKFPGHVQTILAVLFIRYRLIVK